MTDQITMVQTTVHLLESQIHRLPSAVIISTPKAIFVTLQSSRIAGSYSEDKRGCLFFKFP